MSALPPSETPALRTFHLDEGVLVPHPSLQKDPSSSRFSFSHFSFSALPHQLPRLPSFSRGTILALVLLLIPVGVVIAVQPQTPNLSTSQQNQAKELLAQQKAENQNLVASADSAGGSARKVSDATGTDLTQAELAAADSNKTFSYYLTLSKGFLNKAIELSKNTAGQQTEDDKSEILNNLEKALTNVNTAIELDSRQGTAFLLRARIYKTASVIRPELAEKSEQDLQIARALGVDSEALNSSQDPLDYVPTQQANNLDSDQPIVADAEEGSDTTVQTETNSNAKTGQAVLQPGSDSVYVVFPGLTANMQLSVSPAGGNANAQGLTYSVQSRKEGKGFTIRSSAPVEQNVTLDWTASESVE